MKTKRIIFFATPVILIALTLLAVAFCILEIKAHTSLTDVACPLFAELLFFGFPILVPVAWFSGRKIDVTLKQKILVWTPIGIIAVPWGFLLMVFMGFMMWRRD